MYSLVEGKKGGRRAGMGVDQVLQLGLRGPWTQGQRALGRRPRPPAQPLQLRVTLRLSGVVWEHPQQRGPQLGAQLGGKALRAAGGGHRL